MVDVAKDLHEMHGKYGFHESIETFSPRELEMLLDFRFNFLDEEMNEMAEAIDTEDPESIVDALIDLIVVAVGTLDLFKVDYEKAWEAVHKANMSKERGVNPNRKNPLGLPDLIKPEGWTPPTHKDNLGTLPTIWS